MPMTRRLLMAALATGAIAPSAIAAPAQPNGQTSNGQTSSGQAAAPFAIPEIPPLEREDYGEARKRFKTRLLRDTPAPEQSQPLGTPPGAERVVYKGGPDGSLDLIAWVSANEPSAKPKPAVLFLHGGNATGDGHWALMKPYVEAGYVVMLPSFRGENGQAGNFSGFYDETSDVLAAAAYLESLPGIDRDRFFLAGHSNGGTLALLAGMAKKFRAAVPISAGVNSWRFFHRYEGDIRFDTSDPREFVMRSSVCFGPSLKCPTLLLRGTEERPFDQDHQLLIDRVKAAGMHIDAKMLPGNHNGVVPGAVHESIRFFNQVAG